METERLNLLNPSEKSKKSYVQQCLDKRDGPIIAASDYTRAFSDQIRPYTEKTFYSLGTDGYGRSDTRKNLRKFFEVDKEHIVAFTLSALAKEQLIGSKDAEKALVNADITANKNMVPFDDKSPFITSGIRFGTAAVTTGGLKENDMKKIVDFIDQTINNHENENLITKIKSEVNEFMSDLPLFSP